jgi:hypothetical protein
MVRKVRMFRRRASWSRRTVSVDTFRYLPTVQVVHAALLLFRTLSAALLSVSVAGCVSVREVVVVERPAAQAPVSPPSEVSAAALRVSLGRFLGQVSAGRPVDLLLAGDRFAVVTPSAFVEVTATRAVGDIRGLPVSVPGVGCNGPCDRTLGDAFEALAADVSASVPLLVTAESPLESWPTLLVSSAARRWHVSFSGDGRGLFVVELLTGSF